MPGACPFELKTIRAGKHRTYCALKSVDIWVECREYGRCHWAGREVANESESERTDSETERIEANASEDEQMRLF